MARISGGVNLQSLENIKFCDALRFQSPTTKGEDTSMGRHRIHILSRHEGYASFLVYTSAGFYLWMWLLAISGCGDGWPSPSSVAYAFANQRGYDVTTRLPSCFQLKPEQSCVHEQSKDISRADEDMRDRRSCLMSILMGTCSAIYADVADAVDAERHSQFIVSNSEDTSIGSTNQPVIVTLPMEPASGGTFCIRCTLFASGNDDTSTTSLLGNLLNVPLETSFQLYRAIIDTGSPYLVLPSSGLETNLLSNDGHSRFSLAHVIQSFGTLFPSNNDGGSLGLLTSSEYQPTKEVYGSVTGQINWKLANYMFRDPRLQINTKTAAGLVGVLDDALTNEATGRGVLEPYALLGLIKQNNPQRRDRFPDPRPTFFEQECIIASTFDGRSESQVKSFCVNGPMEELTLSTGSLIDREDKVMPLVDLRPYGDFVDHYAVLVDSITIDGIEISARSLKEVSGSTVERPIVAVFDTGLTGCLLKSPMWGLVQSIMLKDAKERPTETIQQYRFQSVDVFVKEASRKGQSAKLKSMCKIGSSVDFDPRWFYVDPIELDWFDDEVTSPYVIVLGQTFMRRGALTIDMDERISRFQYDC